MIGISIGMLIGLLIIFFVFQHEISYHYTRKRYKNGDIKMKVKDVIAEIKARGPETPRNEPYFDDYLSKVDDIFLEFRGEIPALFRSDEYILSKQGKARRRALEALERDYRKYVDYV